MKSTILGALLFLSGCATSQPETSKSKPTCTTPCGLRGDFSEASCVAMSVSEARALYFFTKEVVEFRPGWEACMAVDGYRVSLHADDKKHCTSGWWNAALDECVIGLTRFDKKTIETSDEAWAFNALAHEIGHVLDHDFRTELAGHHCGWTDRHIKRAIQETTGEVDTNDEECTP